MNDDDEAQLCANGWGPEMRKELIDVLLDAGWHVSCFERPTSVHFNRVRGLDVLQLDLLEDRIAVLYRAAPSAQAKGGHILRSGRSAEFLIVGINELLASFG